VDDLSREFDAVEKATDTTPSLREVLHIVTVKVRKDVLNAVLTLGRVLDSYQS